MLFESDKERVKFIFGRDLIPCPKCGSYNLKPQTPVKIDGDAFSDPEKLVAAAIKQMREGTDYLEGPCFIMCFSCRHKGPAMDCSGRTATDVQSDPKVLQKMIDLWNSQTDGQNFEGDSNEK